MLESIQIRGRELRRVQGELDPELGYEYYVTRSRPACNSIYKLFSAKGLFHRSTTLLSSIFSPHVQAREDLRR